MSAPHTPGPWEPKRIDRHHWVIGDGVARTQVPPEGGEEMIEANARLIAAAPDLLELAHQMARECCDCNYGGGATGLGSEGAPCESCGHIRALIEKAEGRA
jgi:hypothetical protein